MHLSAYQKMGRPGGLLLGGLLFLTTMACGTEPSSADGELTASPGEAMAQGVAPGAVAQIPEREPETSPPTVESAPSRSKPRPIDRGRVLAPIAARSVPRRVLPPDFAERGYVEEEFVLSGTATAYVARGELGLNGAWNAEPSGQAAYTTRILVRRPVDASAFNGTAFVEWLNVTGSVDAEVGYAFAWEELLRSGFAYVAVSVQRAGVDALKRGEAARYGALNHPGDTYGYDIFAQAGAAVGWPGEVDPLRGLKVERLIAYGQSQSAMRLITYANAVQPLTHVYDGIIIHARAGFGAPIGTESNELLGNGKPVRVRQGLDAKVLQFFTESEVLFPVVPTHTARQPDTDLLRSWEVAGTAHADARLLGANASSGCGIANAGQQHAVIKAAIRAMHRWLKDGVAPPSGAPIQLTANQRAIARDPLGNALGGIRTPAVDVPIAALSGGASGLNALNPLCMLFGGTVPFTAERLRTLYPTHQTYVDKVTAAARSSREAGFILAEEEATLIAEASAAKVP